MPLMDAPSLTRQGSVSEVVEATTLKKPVIQTMTKSRRADIFPSGWEWATRRGPISPCYLHQDRSWERRDWS